MLMFSLPRQALPGFLMGKGITVRINGVPRLLTFDAVARIVHFTDSSGPQARKFLGATHTEEGDLVRIICAGADGSGTVVAPNAPGSITG